MVELTACVFEDSIPSQYDDSQLVVHFQDWGVFGVKHVMAKKRAHLVDQVGNPVKWAWCYSFMFKESEKQEPFINHAVATGMFLRENAKHVLFTTRNAIASFASIKDLLYIDEVFTEVTNKEERRGLLNLVPPPLYMLGVREEHLLDYTAFPPMNAPALQGPLREHELSQFVFSPTFLALKLASLPSTSHTQQWC